MNYLQTFLLLNIPAIDILLAALKYTYSIIKNHDNKLTLLLVQVTILLVFNFYFHLNQTLSSALSRNSLIQPKLLI